jgi:hypothetical protein
MIKRFIEISDNIELGRYDANNWELLLNIKYTDIAPLCMEMHLLEYKQSQVLTVKSKSTSKIIIFSLSDDLNEKRINIDKTDDKFKVELTFNGLQYIISYLLEYYRDSYAAASHIHLEVSEKSPLGRNGDLTIVAEKSANPMSGEELEKLIEDM